jgi:CRP-like cAMP-binding protein
MRRKVAAEVGNVWEHLSWKERWEVAEGEWSSINTIKHVRLEKKYELGTCFLVVHPMSGQRFNYVMVATMEVGSVLNVRYAADGRLWINGQLQSADKNDGARPEKLTSFSTKQQQTNTAVKTLQHRFRQKITKFSPNERANFLEMFSKGLVRGQFVHILKTMSKKSFDTDLSPKVLNAAWLSVCQNEVSTTTITLEQLKTWYTPSLEDRANVLTHWDLAKSILRQKQSSSQSQQEYEHVREQAHVASIVYQNMSMKRKHKSNLRLQRRLTLKKRNTSVMPVVKQPKYIDVPTDSSDHKSRNSATKATLERAKAIQEDANRSKRQSMESAAVEKHNSGMKLRVRLALRQRAKEERALKNCTLFHHLSGASQDQLVDVMQFEKMKEGTALCEQGSVADRMYLLMSGHCSVQVNGAHVANLHELDVFGENALFSAQGESSKVQSATVTAEEDVEVLVLSRATLKTLLRSKVLDRQTMKALKKVAEGRKQQNALVKEAMHADEQ